MPERRRGVRRAPGRRRRTEGVPVPLWAGAAVAALVLCGLVVAVARGGSVHPATAAATPSPTPSETASASPTPTPTPSPTRLSRKSPGRPVVLIKGDVRTEAYAKPGHTVRQVLAAVGLKPGKNDKVKPGLKAVPAAGSVIRIKEGQARPGVSKGIAGLNWAGLANCESDGRVNAVNPAGYYGLYQFSIGTWRSVGGKKTPVDWGRKEQTYRAQLLLEKVGGDWQGQWPHCGRYL